MRPVIYIALSNKINWQHEDSVWLQISWAQVIIGILAKEKLEATSDTIISSIAF